ncbi:MAG: OpgC domain-containing protein, partial [Reyranellales bacterium]
MAAKPPVVSAGRDIRLDLFRGLALWFIFLDHVPDNVMSWLTVRNYGFSDATEIFVFISGYTAVIAYSRMMRQQGWPMAAARIYRRVWQLYVAHILLFVFFVAQIAFVSIARDTPALIEQMELMGLGQDPYRAMLETALLKFRPVNLDVLPLYIVLLASFPFVLPAVVRWPLAVIAASVVLYAATCHYDWNLPGYPTGKVWFFNPFAWQVVFHTGAACAVLAPLFRRLDRFRWPLAILAILYLLFAGFIALSWHYNSLERLIPAWLARQIYPIDKTNIDILRFVHFLAIA